MVWLVVNALFAGSSLLILPHFVGDFWAFTLALYFLYAIACLGVGLSWGQAGLLSLGQGFFMGFGAYLSGLSLIAYSDRAFLYPLLFVCAIIPGILAYVIGILIFRGRALNGAFFALITLGLVLLASQIATSWNSVTGGYNGLLGIPGLPGMDGFEDIYTISALALFSAIMLVGWLTATPLGVLWRAVAQDERRVAYLGFDSNKLKAIAFGLSGFLGGAAGVLYAPENNLVTPDLFGFVLSTNFIIWVAIGGRATVYGPVLGAVGIGLLTATLRDKIDTWEVVLAVLFIITVLYFKMGLLGSIEPVLKRRLSNISQTRSVAPARKLVGFGTLSIENVKLAAGSVSILDDLSLTINEPGIYCLIGPNGAGKTTTFNALTGEMPTQSGKMSFMSRSLAAPDAMVLTNGGLGRKFQIPNVFDELTIGENMALALWTDRTRVRDLIGFSALNWTSETLQELERRFTFLASRNRLVRELSHGERQVLDLAMVICTEPKVLLLDEPCAGLSKSETEAVTDTIRWSVDTLGATAVIIEHDMALVHALADHVFVLHQGHLLAQGTVAEVQSNREVQAVYGGGTK